MSRIYSSQRIQRSLVTAVGVQPAFWLHAPNIAGANGDAIASVSDSAGGLLTLTQSTGSRKPTLIVDNNGPRRLRLSRTNASALISATGGTTGQHTMICVCTQLSGASGYSAIMGYGPDMGLMSALGLGFTTATNVWAGGSGSGAGQPSPSGAGANVGGTMLIGKIHDSSNVRMFCNGPQSTDLFADTQTISSTEFGLGTRWVNGALPPDCDVISAVWYNQALTGAQYRAAHRTLMHECGLGRQQRVIVLGDSISTGDFVGGLANSWAQKLLDGLPRKFELINLAVSGRTLETIAGDSAVLADIFQRLSLCSQDVFMLFAGTNDISGATLTGTTMQPVETSLCAKIRACGGKVAIFTMLPRGTSEGFATERTVINNFRASNWPSYADEFVDLRGVANLENVNSSSYNVDQTHPNAAGALEIKDQARPVIARLLS